MKRGARAVSCWLTWLLAMTLAGAPAQAAGSRERVLEAQLYHHIAILASDDFGGREPGTEGEAKTLRYIARQFFDIGLVSGTNDPSNEWFAPVNLVAREPASSAASFLRRGRRTLPAPHAMLVVTSGERSLVRDAPLLFVGYGRKDPPPRAELAGRVAVLLAGDREDGERQNALLGAGAAGVLTILDGKRSIGEVAARRKRSGYALASEALGGDIEAFVTPAAFARAYGQADLKLSDLEAQAAAADFAPRVLDMGVTLEATTRQTRIHTHNLIARLPGRHPADGAVLFVAHWDHFGQCAEPPAEDLICNGAIDNASGVAALIEIARRLSKGPRLDRDIYFLATTSEELGLLGAEAFAENPPIPLTQFVAAFNLDSVAIAPANTPLAIVGAGMTSLDPQIAAVAREQGLKLVGSEEANKYVRRQDGWALHQHDVPAVLVSSAYGNMALMEHFFETDYHRPSDEARPGMELGGAAEDVEFHVALGRWFADPRKVPSRVK